MWQLTLFENRKRESARERGKEERRRAREGPTGIRSGLSRGSEVILISPPTPIGHSQAAQQFITFFLHSSVPMAHCIALEYDRYDPSISSFTDVVRQALIAESSYLYYGITPTPRSCEKSLITFVTHQFVKENSEKYNTKL